MADTDLTATLDSIRERDINLWDRRGKVGLYTQSLIEAAHDDVPRLLAAVEAVLARHVPKTVAVTSVCASHGAGHSFRMGMSAADWREMLTACPDCKVNGVITCAACDPVCPDDATWPCDDVKAISRALLGLDGADG